MEDDDFSVVVSLQPVIYPHQIGVQNELSRGRTYTEVTSLLLENVSTASLTQIRVIDLSGQGLGDYRVMQVLSRMYGLPLVDLSLARNGLTDETLYRLSVVLPSLVHLQSLNLSGNQIGDIGIKALFGEDIFPPSLRHLDLSKNLYGHLAAYYIGRLYAMKESKQPPIQSLYLGGHHLHGNSVDFVRILVSFLASSMSHSLQQLSLPFMSFLGTGGLSAVASCVACSRSIVELNISNNPFLDTDCYTFFRSSVACNPFVRNVRLGQCGLSQEEKTLIWDSTSSVYKLSWSEKTRLAILVNRELSECAMARYLLEYKVLSMWKVEQPIEWQDGLPFLATDYVAETYRPLLIPPWAKEGAVPADVPPSFLCDLVDGVNAAWNLMAYLEHVFSECEQVESVFRVSEGLSALDLGTEHRGNRIFTSSEMRQKKEKVGVVNILLRDFKFSTNGDNKQILEVLCMSLEDLLAALVHHEHSLYSKIVDMYSKQLERRFHCTLDARQSSPDDLYRYIPSYRYLGNAALYIHLLYVARPYKMVMKSRAAESDSRSEQDHESLSAQKKRSILHKSSRFSSTHDGSSLADSYGEDMEGEWSAAALKQRLIHRFVPNDRGLFIKLAILRLEASEGERALYAGSRANQRFIANEIVLSRTEEASANIVLEDEAPRGEVKQLSIQTINVGERTVKALYKVDERKEHRLSSRMADLAL